MQEFREQMTIFAIQHFAMYRNLSIVLAAFSLMIVGCSSSEEKTDQSSASKEEKTELLGNANEGEVLYKTCRACHGMNGEGMKGTGAPSLAEQEPYYLKQQLQNFRTNKRGVHEKDFFGAQMAPFAKNINSEGILDVIAYVKTMPAPAFVSTMSGGNVENGKAYYNMICGACHGPGAVGIESLRSPRLAGMQDWYIERQLNNFRQGIRGKEEGDVYGAQMQQIAEAIPDDQTVQDLIAYINSLSAE